MPVYGPLLPSSAGDEGGGGWSWANVANALEDDGFLTDVSATGISQTNVLGFSTFGFDVEPTDIVVGVEIGINDLATFGSGALPQIIVMLRIDDAVYASLVNYADTVVGWAEYGSDTDLWGEELTPEIINANAFGVGVWGVVDQPVGSWAVELDAVRITVHTTEGSVMLDAYPDADIDKAGWTPSSGTDLYAMLDESPSANDADYIEDDAV